MIHPDQCLAVGIKAMIARGKSTEEITAWLTKAAEKVALNASREIEEQTPDIKLYFVELVNDNFETVNRGLYVNYHDAREAGKAQSELGWGYSIRMVKLSRQLLNQLLAQLAITPEEE